MKRVFGGTCLRMACTSRIRSFSLNKWGATSDTCEKRSEK